MNNALYRPNAWALTAILFLAGCSSSTGIVEPTTTSTPASAQSNNTSDLKLFLAGNTLDLNGRYRRSNAPWTVKLFLGYDGTISARSNLGSRYVSDTGQWWINEEGLFCRKFKKWVRGLSGCYRITRQGTSLKLQLISGYGSQKSTGYLIRGNALEQ